MFSMSTNDKINFSKHIYKLQKSGIINNVRKTKWSRDGSTVSKTTDRPRVSPLGDHMKRKYDKEDQPSGEETTWTNTGATRPGRRQQNTG